MQANSSIFSITNGQGRYHLPYYYDGRQVYLTQKEASIVTKLVQGLRTKEIAWELNSSLHTVNTHLANIKEKLNCDNIFQLGLKIGAYKESCENKVESTRQ
jgi:DNA-binding NarL/FixJ family response regulator